MKNKKILWIGILIGFLFACLMFGVGFVAWKLVVKREAMPEGIQTAVQEDNKDTKGENKDALGDNEQGNVEEDPENLADNEEAKETKETIKLTLTELGIFKDSLQEEAFKGALGDDYDVFIEIFQKYQESEDLDGFRSKITIGSLQGNEVLLEGIIMAGPENTFWAAVSDGLVAKYYTNTVDASVLPVTIAWWLRNKGEPKCINALQDTDMRTMTRSDLEDRGFTLLKDHSFLIEIKGLGEMEFIGGTVSAGEEHYSEYYLLDPKGDVVYKFPTAGIGEYVKTRAISFQDLSQGTIQYGLRKGVADIVIMEEITEDYRYGDIPHSYCRIYSWNGEGFTNQRELYEELNYRNLNDNIMIIIENVFDILGARNTLNSAETRLNDKFTRNVVLDNWGSVSFVAAVVEGKDNSPELYLANADNKVLYHFANTREDRRTALKEISFTDVDGEGSKDLIIIAEYEDKNLNTYIACDIYLQNGKEFIPARSVIEELNITENNKTLKKVTDYLSSRSVRLKLSDFTQQGMILMSDRIIPLELEDWGSLSLVPGTIRKIGLNELYLLLVDSEGNVHYRLPSEGERDCHSIPELSLKDINRDGLMDILLVVNYTTGPGTDGITPFPYGLTYLRTEKRFINLPELDLEMNYKVKGITLKKATEYLDELALKE